MKNLFTVFFTLLILAATGIGIWFAGAFLFRVAAVRNGLSDPIPVVSVVLLLATLAITSSLRRAKRREGEHQIREARRQIYEAVMLAWRGSLLAPQNRERRLHEDMDALENRLVLWASPAVLRHYRLLRQLATESALPRCIVDQFLRLVLEMRKDLGAREVWSDEKESLAGLLLGGSNGQNSHPASAPASFANPSSNPDVSRPVLSLGGR